MHEMLELFRSPESYRFAAHDFLARQKACRSDRGIFALGCCRDEMPTDRTLQPSKARGHIRPGTINLAACQHTDKHRAGHQRIHLGQAKSGTAMPLRAKSRLGILTKRIES